MDDLDLQQRQSLMGDESAESEQPTTPDHATFDPANPNQADNIEDKQNDLNKLVNQNESKAKPRSLRTKQSILRKQPKFDETSSTEQLTDSVDKDKEDKVSNGGGQYSESTDRDTAPIIKRKLSKHRSNVSLDSPQATKKSPGQNGKYKRDILPRKFLLSQSSLQQRASQESDPPRRKRHRQPCLIKCCGRSCQWPKLLTWCKCCEQKPPEDDFGDIEFEDEPFRKRCSRACFTFIYIILATVAIVFTYSMVQDLINSMKNPVRSIHYNKVTDYDAPGRLIPLFMPI